MRRLLPFLGLLLGLSACMPQRVNDEMQGQLRQMQAQVKVHYFKQVLRSIEMYRLRNDTYPLSLDSLEFLTAMDSTGLSQVEYLRLDSGYELNTMHTELDEALLNGNIPPLKVELPAGFFEGTGCVRSNLME